MSRVLILLPSHDFDPSEAGIPWRILSDAGHETVFATPDGKPAQADPRMLDGRGLGPWRDLLRADARGRAAHEAMRTSTAFQNPISHQEASIDGCQALLLPGGHAPRMREYLESERLQAIVAAAFGAGRVVGAVCHGVVLAARARDGQGRSVLHDRRTTALTRLQELTAWNLTRLWLGDYYRTYPQTVQAEVTAVLDDPAQFETGPLPLRRDTPDALQRGFVVQDRNYVSARWPGDVHRFSATLASMLGGGEG